MTRRKGQALVEVLVAVSVLTVGFLGIVTLLARALALSRVVTDSYTATYLAAEGIEVAKNILDSNAAQGKAWNDGFASAGDYEVDYKSTLINGYGPYSARPLLLEANTNRYSYSAGDPTPFKRKVSVAPIGDEEVRINSEVTWTTRGGGTSKVNLEDYFYNWK